MFGWFKDKSTLSAERAAALARCWCDSRDPFRSDDPDLRGHVDGYALYEVSSLGGIPADEAMRQAAVRWVERGLGKPLFPEHRSELESLLRYLRSCTPRNAVSELGRAI